MENWIRLSVLGAGLAILVYTPQDWNAGLVPNTPLIDSFLTRFSTVFLVLYWIIAFCVELTICITSYRFVDYLTYPSASVITAWPNIIPPAHPDNPRLKEDICSICRDTFKEPAELGCGHIFCANCIVDYIDNGYVDCAFCKNFIEPNDTMPLTLDQAYAAQFTAWCTFLNVLFDLLRILMCSKLGCTGRLGSYITPHVIFRNLFVVFWEAPFVLLGAYGALRYGRQWWRVIPNATGLRMDQSKWLFEAQVILPIHGWLFWAIMSRPMGRT